MKEVAQKLPAKSGIYISLIISIFGKRKKMAPFISDILKLSIPERILLVEAIWDSIANEKNQSYELSPDQINILEEELEAYRKNPEGGSSWEEVKKRITGK